MKDDFLNVIGLMTGTSMDGIDISLVKTNGVSLKRLNKNCKTQRKITTALVSVKLLLESKIVFNIIAILTYIAT